MNSALEHPGSWAGAEPLRPQGLEQEPVFLAG